ncbi:hypothetical protein Tco_0867913 [Tanacetum coccineum]
MGTPTLVCVWSCPNFCALAGRPFRCVSDIWLLISGDAMDCLQSKGCLPQCLLTQRFPPRLTELRAPECPYHFLRIPMRLLGRLIWMGRTLSLSLSRTLLRLVTPESPFTVAPPTSLPESTPPTLVPILPMSESAFRKRFRSYYESSRSSSPPDLPSRKRYRGKSELVEEDDEEDEEIEESLDSDSGTGDEDPATGDEGPESDGLGVREEEEAVPEGPHSLLWGGSGCGDSRQGSGSAPEPEIPERVSASRQPTLTTWTDSKDGMVYIDVPAYPPPAPHVQKPPSPEWSSSSLPISPAPSIVHSPISSPMIPLTGGLIHDHVVRLEELSPTLFERYDRDIRELFTMSGAVRDEIFSPDIDIGDNQELRLQLVEERRARLELAEIIDNIRRGQEPLGDV